MLVKKLTPLILGIAGLALIIYGSNWVVALGVFFSLWGNNLEQNRS